MKLNWSSVVIVGILTLTGAINTVVNPMVTLEAYKATATNLLLKVKIASPLACWGIVFKEDGFQNILTSASVTYGSLSDTPVFKKVHTPFFMGIKQQTRLWNALLFFGKISPPKVDTKSPYKFISLKLDGFNTVFGKTQIDLKFGYCTAQPEDLVNYSDILKNIKISEEDFHLVPGKNDENLKVDFTFDEDDINDSSEKPKDTQKPKERPKTNGKNIKKEVQTDYTAYAVYLLISIVAIIIFAYVLRKYRVTKGELNLESVKEDKIEQVYK